jgi:hypothetical protein
VLKATRPELFEHARTVIEPVLERLGFSLAEEHYHHRSFGSAFAVYTRTDGELRLIWDAREETLSADYDSRTLIERRTDWLGPSIKTREQLPSMADALVARFGSRGSAKR